MACRAALLSELKIPMCRQLPVELSDQQAVPAALATWVSSDTLRADARAWPRSAQLCTRAACLPAEQHWYPSDLMQQTLHCKQSFRIRGSIVVSISACHAEDPGSIPGRGVFFCSFEAKDCFFSFLARAPQDKPELANTSAQAA